MDALPMQEANAFAHTSTHKGAMHACGHDGHTTMLLAAASHLQRSKGFDGTVYCIFQPAEEGGAGAKAMIDDGLFVRFPMEAVYGMHNWPGMPAGTFAVSAGPVMAATNIFEIRIRGKGAHAAMPHLGVDPVVIAAQMIQAFQTIVSRNVKPLDSAVVSVTNVRAGEVINVIPDACVLKGTVRAFSTDVVDLVETRMRALATDLARAFDARCEVTFTRNYPATVNHARESEVAAAVMRDLVGAERVVPQEPTMGGEDFAFMLQEKPGAYCFLGNGEGVHRAPLHGSGPCMLHNPSYDFNDELLDIGAAYWVSLARSCLADALPL
jgi:amidohydrolase